MRLASSASSSREGSRPCAAFAGRPGRCSPSRPTDRVRARRRRRGNPGGGVELGHDPWDGKVSTYQGVPQTRHKVVNLPGKKKLTRPSASVRRSVRLTGGPLETFGDGSITVHYAGAAGSWPRLTATVTVKGTPFPVTFGSALVTKPSGVLKIPLSDQAVFLPRGKRLVISVG